MNKLGVFVALIAFSISGKAQDLPKPSPTATLNQRVGLTDFTITYSRPSAKDREIFGTLVPYDKLWRTGANKATSIEFNTLVTFGGKEVPAGKYSIFTIPSQAEWTIILNTETELWGTGDYDEAKNIAVVKVKPLKADKVESFTIDINELRNETALLTMHWENTKVGVPIQVSTRKKAMENIKMAIDDVKDDSNWRVYRNAAGYYHNNNINPKIALDYIDQSLAVNRNNWYSHYLRAEILASLDQYKEAMQAANTSLEIGMSEASKNGGEFGYESMISEAMDKYKAQLN
jgi:hypothetical protein